MREKGGDRWVCVNEVGGDLWVGVGDGNGYWLGEGCWEWLWGKVGVMW